MLKLVGWTITNVLFKGHGLLELPRAVLAVYVTAQYQEVPTSLKCQ